MSDLLREKIRRELLSPTLQKIDQFLDGLYTDNKTLVLGEVSCFECGNAADCLHHVVPRVQGGIKTVALCVQCHSRVHGIQLSTSNLIKIGLAAAKKRGVVLGRPKVRDDGAIQTLRSQGLSIRQIAKQLDISVGAVHRAIKGSVTNE